MHITKYVYFLQFCVKDKSWIPIAQFVTFMQVFLGVITDQKLVISSTNLFFKSEKYWRGDEQMLEGGLEALQRPPHQGVTLKRMQDQKR
jgi:hypothetical protein